ncbi:phosphotriesterase family protein [Bacillus smithii]|jgi:phosphotriesterase-related protein|uniref:phosphotriesterase family protein n=1 Tax=Bacillus smithii TaxID=1479 RepID=UPI002E232806|nr:phosphotriesterase-related protein [Bacillus smithii]MED1457646.1 phosphotriesterase-related protein [Bacillus smithii]MED1488805.1 phosphotriesterase-related protein [Bacillus smithii]
MGIQTVTGELAPEQLGKTLMHEHFFFDYAGFQGDRTLAGRSKETLLEEASHAAAIMKKHGVKTVIDPTPSDCGRDATILKALSERSGIHIICASGYYYEGEGGPAYFKFRQALGTAEQEIYDLLKTEVTEGIEGTGIKAGVIKLASSKDRITPYERMFFVAAAQVQKETGVPIVTHTQEGTMGPEQAKLLVENGGIPEKIIIGHMCGNNDIDYQLRTLDYGVNVAFDRFGLQNLVGAPTDDRRIGTFMGLIALGFEDRLFLSHDTVNVWLGRPPQMPPEMKEALKNWQPGHLFENILPKMKQGGLTDEQIDKIFVRNIQRVFS